MLNIDEIQNGIVIDHIKAGTAVGLMDLLGIAGNRTASVALIQNARSNKSENGRKDILKVEGDASWLNLDVLAYLDPNISVTIIENGKAVRKEKPKPPKRLVNIVRCKNPRCISSIEEECDQIFELSSNGKYRCIYCEQELQVKPVFSPYSSSFFAIKNLTELSPTQMLCAADAPFPQAASAGQKCDVPSDFISSKPQSSPLKAPPDEPHGICHAVQ